jgi:hypothetical protein
MKRLLSLVVLTLAVSLSPANAEGPQKNPIAIFAGLDKITGTITTFEVGIDETKRFGSLNVRPRVCYTRPITEKPKTTAFIEVEENKLDGGLNRIFTGWMLAQSPGLNAVEHPVYDIWLTGCRNPGVATNNNTTLPPVVKQPAGSN